MSLQVGDCAIILDDGSCVPYARGVAHLDLAQIERRRNITLCRGGRMKRYYRLGRFIVRVTRIKEQANG